MFLVLCICDLVDEGYFVEHIPKEKMHSVIICERMGRHSTFIASFANTILIKHKSFSDVK